ncbi:MAG: CCA tRNA nucleotidyltransferase [Phycisphaerae bacterium]
MKPEHSAKDAAIEVIRRLRNEGHIALLAGGCVRDALLGQQPKDFDIATDARPDRVLQLFPRARKVGAQFGVMLIRRFGHDMEVATFRTDGEYSDGRRPDSVTFGNPEEDALRRDFTINALFSDPLTDEIIDYVGGREDLANGILRTVGHPRLRFREDHLRMLRAIRFAARLSFVVHDETWSSLCEMAPRLQDISPERIWMELENMLTAPSRVAAWRMLVKSKLIEHCLPDRDWIRPTSGDRPESALETMATRLDALPLSVTDSLVMGAILADHSRDQIRCIARDLRWSNRLESEVSWLVENVSILQSTDSMELADLKAIMNHSCWIHALALLQAKLTANGQSLARLHAILERSALIPPERVNPAPLLDGHSLASLGIPHGPLTGKILREVRRAQLNETLDSIDAATALAKRLAEGND